jgi:hypothetical protein
MLTGRTAKYVEALNREGEKFDYWKWLEKVREEAAQAKHVLAAFPSGEPVGAA